MSYAVGSLVKARDREWVVLPDSEDDFIVLRPLGGSEHALFGMGGMGSDQGNMFK